MKLTQYKIQNAKPHKNGRQKKLFDGNGLYLLVKPSGKYWRYDYQLGGKRKTLALGKYPDIPLAGSKNQDDVYIKGARDLVIEAKGLVKQGIDPSNKKYFGYISASFCR